MDTPALSLRQVVAVLEEMFPPATAQSWDRVGLVTGDPDQPVRTVLLAVDPTLAVVAEARRLGADLLLTHHPLLLRGVHSVATTTAKGAIVTELVVNDVALYCAHTNADVAEPGVGHALAAACGLTETEPLLLAEEQELGRVGELAEETTLGQFVTGLADRLPSAPSGLRVAGDPAAAVRRVAVLGGAGDSALARARASGADVYVTADLRHHPALEAREEAALSGGRPALVDAGHYATERLWLEPLAARLRDRLGAAGSVEDGVSVEVSVSTVCTDPWTFVVGARGPDQPVGDGDP